MKQIYKFLIIGTLLIGWSSFLTSCSNDDEVKNKDEDYTEEENVRDLTRGYNTVYIELEKLPSTLLKLDTKQNIKVELDDPDSFPMFWEAVKDQDGYSQINIIGLKENLDSYKDDFIAGYDLKISTEDDKLSKIIRIIILKKIQEYVNADDSSRTLMWYEYIGHSFFPWASYGSTKRGILNIPMSYLERGNGNGLNWEVGGTRYKETIEQFSSKVGLSFKGPGGSILGNDCILLGGVDLGISGMAQEAVNFEYYFGINSKETATLSIDLNTVKAKLSDFLLPHVANAFNNDFEGSPYRDYDNDSEESMMDFLDHYGAYVILKGSFGGTFIHVYQRLELEYEHSISVDASANLRGNLTDDNAFKIWIDVWRAKNGNYLNSEADMSYYTSEYQEMTMAHGYDFVRGGNRSSDISSWDNSINMNDEKNWVLTRYCTDESDTETIIPIYELITESKRRQAVEGVFKKYFNKHLTEKKQLHLVLADVKMVAESSGNHVSGKGESFIGKGPDGHQYFYYPMMANDNFPIDKDKKYPIETCQDDFIIGPLVGGAHYWYYALGYHELGAIGFTNIEFFDAKQNKSILESEKKEGRTWEPSGDHSNEGITAIMDNNYVYMLPADNNTSYEEKVKGVAIYEVSKLKGDISNAASSILASTGGCEWQHPWDGGKKAFEEYWTNSSAKTAAWGHVFYNKTSVVNTNHDFGLMYNTAPLPVETLGLNWGVGASTNRIQHPEPFPIK